jgi:tetratricopeptide (TPR) repeat protein
MASSWRTRPVFVSSTFRDMQAERDHLVRTVFPHVVEQLAKRRARVQSIDLRLGVETTSVADEQHKEHLVLKVCLDEIERSRPFLIALVGDRYGWVPARERMDAVVEERGFETDTAGKSVTALEIEFGVFKNPSQSPRSFFYLREPLPYHRMDARTRALFSDELATDEGHEDRWRRLGQLKTEIWKRLGSQCRTYRATWDEKANKVTGLAQFGELVTHDLLNALIAEADELENLAPPSELDEFIERRSERFVGREDTVKRLIDHATSSAEDDTRVVCIVGVPGSGKSALFAHTYRQLETRRDLWVLPHASGISPTASDVDVVLRGWTRELATRLGIANPVEDSPGGQELEECFRVTLARACAGRRVVILIDALDQLEHSMRGLHVTWLPRLWPSNARLIATTLPGTQVEALRARPGSRVEELRPIDAFEAEAIARGVYERYHRRPNADTIGELLAKKRPDGSPASESPLWIALAAEQLNLLDQDDFVRADLDFAGTAEQRLSQMVLGEARALPPTVAELYARAFERAERAYGAGLTRATVALIGLSRTGLREQDLLALLPRVARLLAPEEPDPGHGQLDLARLRRGLRAHLVRRGAEERWDFFHRQARVAVEAGIASDATTREQVHRAVLEHLAGLDDEDPLLDEAMFHMVRGEMRVETARFYAAIEGAGCAVATATLASLIAERAGGGEVLEWTLSLLDEADLDPNTVGRLCNQFLFDLLGGIANVTNLDTRQRLVDRVRARLAMLAAAEPSNADWQRLLAVSLGRRGDLLHAQGDTGAALEAYRSGLAIRERLAAADPSNVGLQDDLSKGQSDVGDVLLEQGDAEAALAWFRSSLAISERLAAADSSDVRRQRDLSLGHGRVGDVLRVQGHTHAAVEFFRAALAIDERLAARDPSNGDSQHDLSIGHTQLGDMLLAQGNARAALESFRAALAIDERLTTSDPSNPSWQHSLAITHTKVGDVLLVQGDSQAALASFRVSLSVRARLSGADPTNARWQRDLSVSHGRVGRVLLAQGDSQAALESFRLALAVDERLTTSDPLNANWRYDLASTCTTVGDVLLVQGDTKAALELFRSALHIFVRLSAADPTNASWQHGVSVSHERMGEVHLAQGDANAALSSLRSALTIDERLTAIDPSNMEWRRAAAACQVKIGDILLAQGDSKAALSSFRTSLALLESLAASDPSNGERRFDVAVMKAKVGDALLAQGDAKTALACFRSALVLDERLLASDPANAEWRRDLSVNHEKVGDALLAQGDSVAALASFRAALAIGEALVASDPSNATWQRILSTSLCKVGDLLLAQGDAQAALASLNSSLAIDKRLVASDSSNAEWQRDVAATLQMIGEVALAQDDTKTALPAFRSALAIAKRLAAANPTNGGGQRDLAGAHGMVASALLVQGNAAAALASFRASLSVSKRLAASDPANQGWQHDLAARHHLVGIALLDQGESKQALASFRASLAIRKKLVASEPSNLAWQHHLSCAHEKVGEVLLGQGAAKRALASFRASLAIRKRLVASDESNAEWQHDASVTLEKLGDALVADGSQKRALSSFRASLAIREKLTASHGSNAEWHHDLSVSHDKVGEVLLAMGDAEAALASFRLVLDIRERLAANDPTNAQRQHYLVVALGQIAAMYGKGVDLRQGTACLVRSRDLLVAMRSHGMELAPPSAQWLEALTDSPPEQVLVELSSSDNAPSARFTPVPGRRR